MSEITSKPSRRPSLFRRVLFAFLILETVILFGFIAVAQLFHLDPVGESHWQDTTMISLGVLLILVLPAFVLTWFGGYALVPATPVATFGAFMCAIPTNFWLNWSWEMWLAFVAFLMLCAAAWVRYEKANLH